MFRGFLSGGLCSGGFVQRMFCPDTTCSKGIGAFFRGDWVYPWLPADVPAVSPLHINFKEAFAIYIAARRWAPLWANHHAIIKCDNQAAVAMINKGSTPNPKVMVWLRDLFWISAIYNFCITAVYIKGSTTSASLLFI